MVQPKYSPEEALNKIKLMMNYDSSTTLRENQEKIKSLIKEDDVDTDTEKSVVKILSACSSRPEAEGTIDAASIASAFNRAFNFQTLGFMGGTDDSLWRTQAGLMKKGNLDDLCNVNREFEDLGYGDFAKKLIDELDDEELAELMETFSTMKYRSKKENKLAVASTEQKNINWFKNSFPCIFDSDANLDQVVRKNANNYVYITIKSSEGTQYQVFSDGRVKKMDGKLTGKKISCNGSKVGFISEGIIKKKVNEQFSDKDLEGERTPNPSPNPSPRPRPRPKRTSPAFTACTENMPIKYGCKNETIKKVQACLGLPMKYQTGNFGPITKQALIDKGYGGESITTEMLVAIGCKNNSNQSTTPPVNQAKPDEIEKVDAEDATDLLK